MRHLGEAGTLAAKQIAHAGAALRAALADRDFARLAPVPNQ
jgi:hypothetical protein